MRINRISLSNFRIYKGENILEFMPNISNKHGFSRLKTDRTFKNMLPLQKSVESYSSMLFLVH